MERVPTDLPQRRTPSIAPSARRNLRGSTLIELKRMGNRIKAPPSIGFGSAMEDVMSRKNVKAFGLGVAASLAMAALAGGVTAQERGRINDGQPLQIEREPNGLVEPNPEKGGVIDVDELLGVEPQRRAKEDAEQEKRSANQHSRHKEKGPEGR
ncbi:hypothetical protein [Rhodomicrobium lacus]|uniref:hypothetical protein n=1 Tax=Rhodomicrobium lacus TaxID=2498452 RepID=UPI0026E3BBCC|nr:hypothetical protein [Rhodomicrobium lacus]WKW51334.1 hypothetical protein QMO75_02235 [Rhodomicrobium lacus]